MARVDVDFKELKKSFSALRKHAPSIDGNPCCFLDTLYAVECGLAIILLRDSMCSTTKELPSITPHDIRTMLGHCKGAPSFNLPSQLPVKKIPHMRSSVIYLRDLHSALRYGATLHSHDLEKCAIKIENIIKWIESNIKGR